MVDAATARAARTAAALPAAGLLPGRPCCSRSTGWPITSIKPNRELYSPKIMPLHRPPADAQALRRPALPRRASSPGRTTPCLVAVVTTAVSLVLGTMIAYPLARMRFPGAAVVAIGVAATYLVPQPLLFIPMADIINRLELGNTLTRGDAHVSHAPDPVLRLAADGLLQERAARAGGGRAHRRRQPVPGDDAHRAAALHARASSRPGSSPSPWPRTSSSTR